VSTCIIPQTRPRRTRCQPIAFDPYRRLMAAIAAQAVLDYLYPPQSLTQPDRESARLFCAEQFDLLADLSDTTPEFVSLVLGAGSS